MTHVTTLTIQPPRSHGTLHIAAKSRGAGASAIADLRQQGSAKVLMTPARDAVEGIILNTSGGLTGGDTLAIQADAQSHARLRLTTQAAERVYRSPDARFARVRNTLTVAEGGRIDWLPQETILFQNGALRRSLRVDMAPEAHALIVEPVLFGRLAMGEVVTEASLLDDLTIRRGDTVIFKDTTRLTGDIAAKLDKPAVGGGARAMALVVYAAPDADRHIDPIRADLPNTAGVSLVHDGCLVLRALAPDGFELRRTLIPILERLSGDTLPRSWRL
ncbi:urease accessory protein UreD [Marivita hallyeonensis]|uniref:Urease accessory protein UreD n=1 Tax=Marivita hallyeonensis TaxID=996342 RepID=A0A1M5X5Q7_9RHOB|nr:urease accessory protein UreD [Marivita hallyeonensis]SHH95180.1 urease accessory protein [Marivita hallyeonensis]